MAAEFDPRVSCCSSRLGFEAEADGVADVLVGFAEGDALVGEVGGGGHGVEVAGCGRRSSWFRSGI